MFMQPWPYDNRPDCMCKHTRSCMTTITFPFCAAVPEPSSLLRREPVSMQQCIDRLIGQNSDSRLERDTNLLDTTEKQACTTFRHAPFSK